MHYLVKSAETPRNASIVVCTDFTKGFDRVNHTIAVNKLLFLGARPSIIPWICDFLTNRTNCVRYQGTLSTWQQMRAGVPQGTLLGPLIFLSLIDDALRDQPVMHWKYVDDMSIADSVRTPAQISNQLLDSLATLENWCSDNYVKLNPKKCSVLQITFSKAPLPDPDILLCDQKLNLVKHAKILGVIVQDDLKWDLQVDNMVSRASRRLFMLRSLKAFRLPIDDLVKLTVYNKLCPPAARIRLPSLALCIDQNSTKPYRANSEKVSSDDCYRVYT